MMRNNDEFKAEIFRRKTEYLKKRKVRMAIFSSAGAMLVLCFVVLCGMFSLFHWGENGENGVNGEEIGDVIITIRIADKTQVSEEDVDRYLQVLQKYAPLPEGEDLNTDEEPSRDMGQSADSVLPSGGNSYSENNSSKVFFTVTVGAASQTYYLYDSKLVSRGVSYPLTQVQFEELYALFGNEVSK